MHTSKSEPTTDISNRSLRSRWLSMTVTPHFNLLVQMILFGMRQWSFLPFCQSNKNEEAFTSSSLTGEHYHALSPAFPARPPGSTWLADDSVSKISNPILTPSAPSTNNQMGITKLTSPFSGSNLPNVPNRMDTSKIYRLWTPLIFYFFFLLEAEFSETLVFRISLTQNITHKSRRKRLVCRWTVAS